MEEPGASPHVVDRGRVSPPWTEGMYSMRSREQSCRLRLKGDLIPIWEDLTTVGARRYMSDNDKAGRGLTTILEDLTTV